MTIRGADDLDIIVTIRGADDLDIIQECCPKQPANWQCQQKVALNTYKKVDGLVGKIDEFIVIRYDVLTNDYYKLLFILLLIWRNVKSCKLPPQKIQRIPKKL